MKRLVFYYDSITLSHIIVWHNIWKCKQDGNSKSNERSAVNDHQISSMTTHNSFLMIYMTYNIEHNLLKTVIFAFMFTVTGHQGKVIFSSEIKRKRLS